jgi:RHS repeat-associated protein
MNALILRVSIKKGTCSEGTSICWRLSFLIACILFCAYLRFENSAVAQCSIPPIIEYQTTAAFLSKCAINTFTNSDLPRLHVYHELQVAESYSLSYSTSDTLTTNRTDNPCCDAGCNIQASVTYYPGSTHSSYSYSRNPTFHFYKLGPGCTGSNYNNGMLNLSDEHDNSMVAHWNTHCDGTSECVGPSYSLHTQAFTVAGNSWNWTGTEHNESQNTDCATNTTSSTNDYASGEPIGFPDYGVLTYESSTEEDFVYVPSPEEPDPPSASYTKVLVNEYTDEELRGYIMNMMPAYSDWYQDVWGCAYSSIGGSHLDGCCYWSDDASLQKMKYHFGIPNSEVGTTYHITWDLITWDLTTGQVDTAGGNGCDVTGTGDTNSPAYSGDYEVLPPYWDQSRTDCGGAVITFLANVQVSATTSFAPAVPGSGPYPALAGGCKSCGESASHTSIAGFNATFAMGASSLDRPAPDLMISSSSATTNLAMPVGLYCDTNNPNVEVIQIGGQIRQVKAPQALADIVTLDGFSYEIRYYLASQVGSKVGGVYTFVGSPTPFVTWKIENPDASTTTYNRIRITETRGTDVRTYESTNTLNTSNWQRGDPGNLVESDQTTTITTNGTFNILSTNFPAYIRTLTSTTKVPGSSDQMKMKRVYQRYDWGEGIVSETLNPDTDPKTTTYTYYNGYSTFWRGTPVQKVTHPDGSWEWYTYDSSLRVSTNFSSLGDVAASGTAPPSTCRRVEYFYGDSAWTVVSGSGDDGSLFPDAPRCVAAWEVFSGTGYEVSRRFTVYPAADIRIDIQASAPGAAWSDSANLFTTNKFYSSGPNLNRLKSVVHPDGTLTTYNYADDSGGNYRTNMTATGQPNSTFTTVVVGTTNWSVVNLSRQPVISVSADIASGGIVLMSETYTNFDDFGRPGRVTHLDGTFEDTYYSCCGLDHTVDRDGVTTSYIYDAAHRQVAQTRLGITTTNILDSAGHTLKTIRIGTDASQIVQSQAQFDLAGQLIKQTNALNGITSYSEITNSSGNLIRITTYPDLGTRYQTNYLDGRLKQVAGTAVNPVRYEYGIQTTSTGDSDDLDRRYTLEVKLNVDGSDSSEWTKTFTDNLGRAYKTMYSDGAYSKSWHNAKGQLWKEQGPDGVVTLYQYDAKGELQYTAVDMDRHDTIDLGGTDRITQTTNDVVYNSALGANVRRSRSYVWSTDSSATPTLLSTMEASTDGLHRWQTMYRDGSISVTNRSDNVYAGSGYRYSTNIAPDRSYTFSITRYGTNVSSTLYDANNNQLQSTSYLYDTHLRANRITDARNGTTTNWFNNEDQVSGTKTPVPTAGQSALVTSNFFDGMGRIFATKLPDSTFVTNKFDLKGMVTNTFGSRTYPVAYTYDAQGRQKTMKTWQNYAGNQGVATTTWNYDLCRGWMTNKTYADGHGPNYTYTAAGRLNTRVWVRGITTSYGYNNAGDLSSVGYSDGTTPGVSYTFDRRGRQKTITQNSITTTFTYNDASEVLTESYSGGTLDSLSVTNGYDQLMRRTNLAALYSTTPLLTNAYSYDAASRLLTVKDGGTNSATYTYVANSFLVSQIVFTNGSIQRMVTTKSYDMLNRLTNTVSVTNGIAVASFAYQYNSANQRTKRTDVDGSYWVYTYDSLGQVTSGKKYWSDGTSVAGMQFTYSFDDIGNRKVTGSGGDQTGGPLRSANYGNNSLNQIASKDVPGFVDVIGSAKTNATVSLWTPDGWWAPTIRHADYYRGELPVNNSTGALWLAITNLAILGNGTSADINTNIVGNLFLPKNQEIFSYDPDGNLTDDGRWSYTWDAENRLTRMVANTIVGPQQRLDFEYDSKSRRIRKKVWNNTAGTGPIATDLTFAYDSWNLMGELNSSHAAIKTYVWGLDLSASLQGAGGVSGLLQMNDPATGMYLATFDGNGNAMALVKASDGSSAAAYDYGPFGEVLRAAGPMPKANPFRYSTKFQDDETDLLYYGYRYYNASTGRWVSRDPVEEQGGENIYQFVGNNPVSGIDFVGLVCPCDVESFSITSRKWVGNLPTSWEIFGYSKRLRIQFKLVLKPGSDRSSCLIGQNRKGEVHSRVSSWISANWVPDPGLGGLRNVFWWDGSSWQIRHGDWSGLTATFRDEPGFRGVGASAFPLYYNVDFYTYVRDRSKSGIPEVAHLSWGVFIYYSTPSTGYEIYN